MWVPSIWTSSITRLSVCVWMQQGMEQHYAVGQYFRRRYIEGQPYRLLSEAYDRHQVSCLVYSYTTELNCQLCVYECSRVWSSTMHWASTYVNICVPAVLWCCWLGGRKVIRPVKNWVIGFWCGYLSGAKCRLAYGPANTTSTHCLCPCKPVPERYNFVGFSL